MEPRERVRLSLSHTSPDRIPLDFGSRSSAIEEEAYTALKAHLGIQSPTRNFLRAHAVIEESVAARLGIDTRWVRFFPDSCWKTDGNDCLFVDMWGVPWRKRNGSFYYELDSNPFSQLSRDEVRAAHLPPILTDEVVSRMQAEAEHAYCTGCFVGCDMIGAGVFERAWYLRGFEEFMFDLMDDEYFARTYLEKILIHQIEAYDRIAQALSPYIEAVLITDDIATQDSLMISPETYRTVVKPVQKALLEHLRSLGLQVVFHSCGAVAPLITDLIEIGVEIMHPIQVSAKGMDTRVLKREFGKDLVFWGGGCDIEVLQYGTADAVREEVKRRCEDLAEGGGFVFTTTHCIQPNTPPENIMTMIETLREFNA